MATLFMFSLSKGEIPPLMLDILNMISYSSLYLIIFMPALFNFFYNLLRFVSIHLLWILQIIYRTNMVFKNLSR